MSYGVLGQYGNCMSYGIFSVGDTTPHFTISIEQKHLALVTLNIMPGVAIGSLRSLM